MYFKVDKECLDGLDAGSRVLEDMCRLKPLLEKKTQELAVISSLLDHLH